MVDGKKHAPERCCRHHRDPNLDVCGPGHRGASPCHSKEAQSDTDLTFGADLHERDSPHTSEGESIRDEKRILMEKAAKTLPLTGIARLPNQLLS